jgi:hypothetical protein
MGSNVWAIQRYILFEMWDEIFIFLLFKFLTEGGEVFVESDHVLVLVRQGHDPS